VAKFNKKVNMTSLYKRALATRDVLLNGDDSYENILEQQLLPNYFLMDS